MVQTIGSRQSKVAHTLPRQLCLAVLALELYETVKLHTDIKFQKVVPYTDRKVVLGYVHNETRRFYTYVANRVQMIKRSSKPEQWKY